VFTPLVKDKLIVITLPYMGTTVAPGSTGSKNKVTSGTIDLSTTGDSNNTNSALQQVTLFFDPVDPGATVVPI